MNKTYKTNNQLIEIEATATNVINTNVVFWSHDKGVARLKFKLKKEGAIFPLTEGTIVPICLLFDSKTAADGIGRHVYNATIEDKVEGIVSIILPTNIMGYQGIVNGSIYVDLPNEQHMDTAGRFTFAIKRSPIDDIVPELQDYYYAGFDEIDQKIKDALAKIIATEVNFNKQINTMQSKLNNFETSSKNQMDAIQKQITEKSLYTKKETDDRIINTVTTFLQVHRVYNYINKKVGSFVENPHCLYRYGIGTSLRNPSASGWVDTGEGSYANTLSIDGKFAIQSATKGVANQIPQMLAAFDLVSQLEREYPYIFSRQGITTTAEKARWVRNNANQLAIEVWGRGNGMPSGQNLLRLRYWTGSEWDANSMVVNSTDNIAYLRLGTPASAIQDNGKIYFLLWTATSTVSYNPEIIVDAIQFNHSYKINMTQFYVPQTQVATATQPGIVKVLNTNGSTDTLSALSANAGKVLADKLNKIPIPLINMKPVSDPPSSYADGITIFDGGAASVSGYPQDYSVIVTIKYNVNRIVQYCYPKAYTGAFANSKMYFRGAGEVSNTWDQWLYLPHSNEIAALMQTVVKLTGNQTITGTKNFSSIPQYSGKNMISDTGWLNLALGTGWKNYGDNTNNRPRIRKRNGLVMVSAVIQPTTSITNTGASVTVIKGIPSSYWPAQGLTTGELQQGSGNNRFYARPLGDGTIVIDRYFNGSGVQLDYSNTHWYPIKLAWFAGDELYSN
ncbi:hypothetical protein IGI37_000110 [Enterococcus sp. AZ194]|uniref:BppU family phage baseplate upper protein n=1 Tax=Enterococcus sp. AZ194 TaxID=2774629 RepID=UPI003F277735